MIEVKSEETETPNHEANETKMDEETTTKAATPEPPLPPPQASPQPPQPAEEPPSSQSDQNNSESTVNSLNGAENHTDSELKTKHRRYWAPKEEEKLFRIWGRENWRLTKHGKNTIFFAQWADEMKERFNIDVKPEEVQCKVNQTRAKFRQVKKMMETNKNAVVTWKKYYVVEKILKNQYRSKDDDPVPPEAIENNRDYSPTELLNCATQPCSPNSMSNMSNIPEQNINLSQPLNVDHQLTDETNLSDHNLYNNNSQTGNSFSTELFGSDQLEIKEEEFVAEDFPEWPANQTADGSTTDAEQSAIDNQTHMNQNAAQPSLPQQVPLTENTSNLEHMQIHSSNPSSLLINNQINPNRNSKSAAAVDGIVNCNNHANNNSMQPPKVTMITPSPRKRNRTTPSTNPTPLSCESLEALYLEEIKKKNVLLVEQGEVSRKRLRLEEKKVKLMEEFFPKFMTLQQDILKKLETVTNNTPSSNNVQLEE